MFLPSQFPSISLSPSPSLPFPYIQLGGLGECCELPRTPLPGAESPAAEIELDAFNRKICHQVTTILVTFLREIVYRILCY